MKILPEQTPSEAMTKEKRVALLANLLMSEPWTLVACGLGKIKGEDLAKYLLTLSSDFKK